MEKKFEVRDRRDKERFYLDDQYLNGKAKLCGIYATGVYVSLCRHANLEQKCWPSIKKIAEELAISEKQVGRAIKILEDHQIIAKERVGKKANNRYWLLSKREWTTSPISEQTTSPITTDSQSDHHRTTSPFHSKDTQYKDTQERKARAPDLIAEVINLFRDLNPSYKDWFGRKPQREAAQWMLDEFGLEKVTEMVAFLPKLNAMPYAPVTTSPYELKAKYPKIKAFVEQEKNKKKLPSRSTPNFIL